jgi:hypothetical protein
MTLGANLDIRPLNNRGSFRAPFGRTRESKNRERITRSLQPPQPASFANRHLLLYPESFAQPHIFARQYKFALAGVDETASRRFSLARLPSLRVSKVLLVAKNQQAEVQINRRAKSDRRGDDRRKQKQPVPVERRQGERREKVQRRRQIDPTTCEREYSNDEIEFMHALDAYKRASGRMFPTCSEILEVIRDLGYVRLAAGATGGMAPTISATNEEEVEDL